jgi:hypothetical protein
MAFSLLALRLGKDHSINLSLRECRHKSGPSRSRLNFSNPSIECNHSVAPLTLAPATRTRRGGTSLSRARSPSSKAR